MASRPPQIEQHVTLPDGRGILLRPLLVTDERAYRLFVATLSARSQYYRFFSARRDLTEREIDHFLHVDYVDRLALVAVHRPSDGERAGDGEIVAVSRYDRTGDDPLAAEVAFIVRDDFQGRGIAPHLLRLMAVAAHRQGIRRFVATVLPDNVRMLKVFAATGWVTARRLEDGAIAVTLDIDRPEARVYPETGKA
jgi:RimJ/RimL family protein N-acetyltransferase